MVTDEPVRGVYAYLEHPGILSLPGLEQMRRWQKMEFPYPPIWYIAGAHQVEGGPGMSTWRMPLTGWLRSAAGTVTGGVLAFAADAPLGTALFTTLPPMTFLATSELSFHFVRPPASGSEAVITRARIVQAGRSQGLTEATIEDDGGHVLAHAIARNIITTLPVESPDGAPDGPIPWPEYEGPHPIDRPPDGEVIPQEVWNRMSGREMAKAWREGELPYAPLTHFVGAHSFDSGEGTFSMQVPASRWFTTSGGAFYGGAVAMFLDYAVHGAIHTTLPAGTSWATLDLKVNFLRPVTPDDSNLTVRGHVLHRGRTIAVAAGEIVAADGKTIALANTSAMLLPNRPWFPSSPAAPLDEAASHDD